MKSRSKKRTPNIVNLTVKRRYLTQREIERLMDCARKHGRYGHRDATMILVAYRHGLRASEVCDLQRHQIELSEGRLHVHRVKNGIPSVHPIRGDHRLIQRIGEAAKMPFPIHPHMLRHACGLKLANDGPTHGLCSTTSGTKTSSTPSGIPTWHPIGSRTFGGVEPERPLHDALVGTAGAGKLGTISASPSISVARSPAFRAIISSSIAMASSVVRQLAARGGPGDARPSFLSAPTLCRSRLNTSRPSRRRSHPSQRPAFLQDVVRRLHGVELRPTSAQC